MFLGGYDSYDRWDFTGHGDIHWARTKNAPIRRFVKSRFGIRVPDCLGNPSLQLSTIIGTGLDGVRKQSRFEMKESPWTDGTDPMPEEMKKSLGITERFPMSLDEAIGAMEKDGLLREILGDKWFDS